MSRKLDKDEILHKLFYNVDEGFGSVRDLYEKANKVEAGFTLDYVSKWMKSQPNKQTRNYKNYNSYTAPFPKYEFQIDLMVMSSLLNDVGENQSSRSSRDVGENQSSRSSRDVGVDVKNQPKFGFVCIDIFSKKCHIVPMENNDIETFFNAMLECFKVLGYPLSIYSDDEGALNSKKIQNYLKGEGIELIITKTHASQAERAIRTFKKMISDRLRHNPSSTWVEMMKASLKKYNNSQVHSSTGMVPNKAHDLDNALEVRSNQILKEKQNRKYPNVTEGDYVKVYSKGKGNFVSKKESRSVWSERKYKVILVGKDLLNNKYYKLDGLSKKYNRHEILLVN